MYRTPALEMELLMHTFDESMAEYRKQLQKGQLQTAYQGLMAYFRDLRSHFERAHPHYPPSANIYYGYMDMTYFALFPESLKARKLKIPIVFVHDTFRFEVWLSGANRRAQSACWELLQEIGWNKYRLAKNPRTEDFVIAHILEEDPDFSDLTRLTGQIDAGTAAFIREIENKFAELET